ncbi:unnamed protein product, partial [Didymodactylos carnosus]
NGHENLANVLLNVMLHHYVKIFQKYIPVVKEWKHPVKHSMYHLTDILNHGVSRFQSYVARISQYLSIIDGLLVILNEPLLLTENAMEKSTNIE